MTAKPELINEPKRRGIRMHGWTLSLTRGPILSDAEQEALTKRLGFPLPEMVFGEACLSLEHAPSGFAYSFSAIPALERVDRNPKEGAMKVAYAESWMKERSKCEEAQTVAKYYDWTFTTDYTGSPGQGGEFIPSDKSIDYARLQQREPILWFDECIFFEDELGDNGASMLSVRIRVMASGFFLLQRFFLRVDDVLFRIRDTRMYHAFGTGEIVREYCEREAGYEEVKAHLGKGKDGISKLADAGWVSDQIPEVALLQESVCVLE